MRRTTTRRLRRWGAPALAAALVLPLAACDDINTVKRADAPVVLTGADLTDLLGADPGSIVAFRHTRPADTPTWTQIPVQVDERAVVDFGAVPADNTTPGVTGTVYGTSPVGVTALQYTDPGTFVGADPDATFDSDDELVFMAADGGGTPRDGEASEPAGVVPGSGVEVRFDDPLGTDQTGWVYLFLAAPDVGGDAGTAALDPSAGADYVAYDFSLISGDYKTTYKRNDGPNAETSTATTGTYQIEFSDRWIEDSWRISAGGATGVDILDGNKNRFHVSTCIRSNATFATAEGAFIANIDGPVRAIRSYVGANSGPITQRTHLLYKDREEIATDLRVHSIPGVIDFVDYSQAAIGMTYRSSTVVGSKPIDGAADIVPLTIPDWELVSGPQGSVTQRGVVEATMIPTGGTLDDVADSFYHDELNSGIEQCWGDNHFIGASGINVNTSIPNTDPLQGSYGILKATRTVRFGAPSVTAGDAAAWADAEANPLVLTVSAFTP